MSNKRIRQPIVAVLGHIDHGKTTLLDKIRGTSVAQKEAGGITQHIGATEIPLEVIGKICGPLIGDISKIKVPGLLFIDTPGHEAFSNLRARGGALADLAILVIDINDGVMPQTRESITILKRYKTPFVVAANKIDRIPGWVSYPNTPFILSYKKQKENARKELDMKIYELMGQLANFGFDSDRYDKISDFTRYLAIVPISAKTGEGIPDLLSVLIGLAQKYLADKLEVEEKPGEGTILEIKNIHGMGTVADVIFYNGIARVGDRILMARRGGGIIRSKIKGMLRPKPLTEIREVKGGEKLEPVEEVSAAVGVRVLADGIEEALPGGPIRVVWKEEEEEEVLKEIEAEVSIQIETEENGIVVKADTLGSLEGLAFELKEEGIPIKRADIGPISKKDVIEASMESDITHRVILGFNVKVLPDAQEMAEREGVRIFLGSVIYKLVEEYLEWCNQTKENLEKYKRMTLVYPVKFKILPGYVFRTSKPAIVGVKVLAGTLRRGIRILRPDGKVVGLIRSIQKQGQNIEMATEGEEVAIGIEGVTIGRQLKEGDVLYGYIPKSHLKVILREKLSPSEEQVLKEIKEIMKKVDPFWGSGI